MNLKLPPRLAAALTKLTALGPRVHAALAVLVALAGLVTITLVDTNHDGTPDHIHVAPRLATTTAPPAIADHAPAVAGAPAASDTAANVPGVDEAKAKADNAARADAQTYDASGVLQGATAEPAHLTCHTAGHGAQRTLRQIRLGVVHVTVGPNAPGLTDIHGLCSYFAGQKLSATWIVDNEGNSAENEPLTTTPWTQAFYNTYACSIEFVGYTGRPGEGAAQWTDTQYREGARLMAQCFKKAGIPVQRGAVTSGGHILKAGVITHQELGLLGGGHTDPGPKFDMTKYMSLVKAYATTGTPYTITATDKTTCRKLNWWRRAGRPHGRAEANAVRRRKALAARHVTCTSAGPRIA